MTNTIDNLKDFSISKPIKSPKLYKKLQDINLIPIYTSSYEVISNSNNVELIAEIKKGANEGEILITTFGYVGKFSYLGVTFNIGYRFGNVFLDRMVAKVNDFEMKSMELEAKNTKNKKDNDNLVMRMLFMHFILKLEKLSILGLPKSYVKIEHHDKFRGQIDINHYIKKDIPFQGKISSTSYEQEYIQEIVDVLYSALNIVENYFKELVTQRVFQTRNLLNHYSNKQFVDEDTMSKALNHKVLQNSLYSEFKGILEIASYIIRNTFNITYKNNNFLNGLVFDVSLLWEAYLYKLLKENFEDDNWKVIHEEELTVYNRQFFKRGMKPDIVIKNEKDKKILVFDAKSKNMHFNKGLGDGSRGDLDRSDFFQIHTYMSYYDKQGNLEVIAGGLLYPIEKEFDCRFSDEQCDEDYEKLKAHADNWFGNLDTKFIVDGIDLSYVEKGIEEKMTEEELTEEQKEEKKSKIRMKNIVNAEEAFIQRIKKIAGEN